MSLRDLDELVLTCRTDEARTYVSEAVACYKAGAFRACIVATWIAVVYDLLAKIRELSLGGDTEAQGITTELGNLQPRIELGAIRRILEIERDIVDVTNDKFGFFEGQQVLDLTRLQDDRNRCTHPTYQGSDQPYSPSAELARAHLVHAVVTSSPYHPCRERRQTTHSVRLVESNFFPTDVEQAKVQLRSGGLERPKDSLVRAVTDRLVFGMLEGGKQIKARRQTAAALRATYELHPGLSEPRIREALNAVGRMAPDGDLIIFFLIQRYLPQTWDFLEQDNQTRLTALLRLSSDDIAKLSLPSCLDLPALADVCITRINALGHEPLGELLNRTKPPVLIARAVDIYCSSRSWDTHYNHVIEPVIGNLN